LFLIKLSQEARSTWMCKCRLKQDAGCDHSQLRNDLDGLSRDKKASKVGGLFVAGCLLFM